MATDKACFETPLRDEMTHWEEVMLESMTEMREAQLTVARSRKTIEMAKKRRATAMEKLEDSYEKHEKRYKEALAIVDKFGPTFGGERPVLSCVICMDHPRDAFFQTCHHVVCCMSCVHEIEKRCVGKSGHEPHFYYKCPVCHTVNSKVEKVLL